VHANKSNHTYSSTGSNICVTCTIYYWKVSPSCTHARWWNTLAIRVILCTKLNKKYNLRQGAIRKGGSLCCGTSIARADPCILDSHSQGLIPAPPSTRHAARSALSGQILKHNISLQGIMYTHTLYHAVCILVDTYINKYTYTVGSSPDAEPGRSPT